MSSIWSQTILHTEDVLHQELGGETVLLNLKTEHYFGLDPLGTRIWNLFGETSCAETLVKTLLEEYDVDEAQLRVDVECLVSKLAAAGLLRLSNA